LPAAPAVAAAPTYALVWGTATSTPLLGATAYYRGEASYYAYQSGDVGEAAIQGFQSAEAGTGAIFGGAFLTGQGAHRLPLPGSQKTLDLMYRLHPALRKTPMVRRLVFDPNERDFGASIKADGTTTVGRQAFKNSDELIDTIIHENFHERIRLARNAGNARWAGRTREIEENYVQYLTRAWMHRYLGYYPVDMTHPGTGVFVVTPSTPEASFRFAVPVTTTAGTVINE